MGGPLIMDGCEHIGKLHPLSKTFHSWNKPTPLLPTTTYSWNEAARIMSQPFCIPKVGKDIRQRIVSIPNGFDETTEWDIPIVSHQP